MRDFSKLTEDKHLRFRKQRGRGLLRKVMFRTLLACAGVTLYLALLKAGGLAFQDETVSTEVNGEALEQPAPDGTITVPLDLPINRHG